MYDRDAPFPEDYADELRRLNSKDMTEERRALTMLLGRLHFDEGYPVRLMKPVLEMSDTAIYSRLKTYKRVMSGVKVPGYETYGPELDDDQKEALTEMVTLMCAPDLPHDREPEAQYMFYEAKFGATRWVEEALYNAREQGIKTSTLAEIVGKTPQWVAQQISRYRRLRG